MSLEYKRKTVMYKYMYKKYLPDFINYGRLRVGTVYDFRKIEDSEIGDSGEGSLIYINFRDNLDLKDENIIFSETGERYEIFPIDSTLDSFTGNNVIVNTINYEDSYIFCVTHIPPTKDFMEKIRYDSCVKIHDFALFTERIAERMHKLDLVHNRPGINNLGLLRGDFVASACTYNGRISNDTSIYNIPWYRPESPHFQKEPKHSYQEEIRIVMPPNNSGTIVPVNITCGNIIELCTDVTPSAYSMS